MKFSAVLRLAVIFALDLRMAAVLEGFPHSAMRDANSREFVSHRAAQTLKMRVSGVRARENHPGGSL
jgi:hypothetical protein